MRPGPLATSLAAIGASIVMCPAREFEHDRVDNSIQDAKAVWPALGDRMTATHHGAGACLGEGVTLGQPVGLVERQGRVAALAALLASADG